MSNTRAESTASTCLIETQTINISKDLCDCLRGEMVSTQSPSGTPEIKSSIPVDCNDEKVKKEVQEVINKFNLPTGDADNSTKSDTNSSGKSAPSSQ